MRGDDFLRRALLPLDLLLRLLPAGEVTETEYVGGSKTSFSAAANSDPWSSEDARGDASALLDEEEEDDPVLMLSEANLGEEFSIIEAAVNHPAEFIPPSLGVIKLASSTWKTGFGSITPPVATVGGNEEELVVEEGMLSVETLVVELPP